MRVRVEFEDNARKRQKLREAKIKAQLWLSEAKNRSVRKLSFRRSHSNSESASIGAYFGINFGSPATALASIGQPSLHSSYVSHSEQTSISALNSEASALTNKTSLSNRPRPPSLQLSLSEINHISCATTPTPKQAQASELTTKNLIQPYNVDYIIKKRQNKKNYFQFLPEIVVHCDEDQIVDDSSSSMQFSRYLLEILS